MNLDEFRTLVKRASDVRISTPGYTSVRVQVDSAITWFIQTAQWVFEDPLNRKVWVIWDTKSDEVYIAESLPLRDSFGGRFENFLVEGAK